MGSEMCIRDSFHSGIRPAVDVGVSVSRVGGDAQVKAVRSVAGKLRLDLAAHRELEDFARLGTELDATSQRQLDRGYRMVELLKQPQFSPLTVGQQVITILSGSSGLLDSIPVAQVAQLITDFLASLARDQATLISEIDETGVLGDDLSQKITDALKQFIEKGNYGSTD